MYFTLSLWDIFNLKKTQLNQTYKKIPKNLKLVSLCISEQYSELQVF